MAKQFKYPRLFGGQFIAFAANDEVLDEMDDALFEGSGHA